MYLKLHKAHESVRRSCSLVPVCISSVACCGHLHLHSHPPPWLALRSIRHRVLWMFPSGMERAALASTKGHCGVNSQSATRYHSTQGWVCSSETAPAWQWHEQQQSPFTKRYHMSTSFVSVAHAPVHTAERRHKATYYPRSPGTVAIPSIREKHQTNSQNEEVLDLLRPLRAACFGLWTAIQEEKAFRSRWRSDRVRRAWRWELRTRLGEAKGEGAFSQRRTYSLNSSFPQQACCGYLHLDHISTVTCLNPLLVFAENCCFYYDLLFSEWLTYFQITKTNKQKAWENSRIEFYLLPYTKLTATTW